MRCNIARNAAFSCGLKPASASRSPCRARILHTRGLSTTVLESDGHAYERPQGGSLDLHAQSGLRALRVAGLAQAFDQLARYEDQSDRVYDRLGTLRYANVGPVSSADEQRPEIDRTQLRDLLSASLPESYVRWGSKVLSIEPEGNRYRVLGAGGCYGVFDEVVGADGAWSKVRPLVSTVAPTYTGVTCIELSIDAVDSLHPEVARLVPHGKTMVPGAPGLIVQRSSGSHVRAYYMFRAPLGWHERAFVRCGLKRELHGWAEILLSPIEACCAWAPRPLVELPVGHQWTHRPGVTLLGDAAHVMSPFSGEGVNMAMLDAVELADALMAQDWDAAIARYEQSMFVRAAQVAAGAHDGLDFVSEGALDHVLEHLQGHFAE